MVGDGRFTIDLPRGRYVLQLVDIETGLVFHTEGEEYEARDAPLVLRPTIHWLELSFACTKPPAVLKTLSVEVDRPGEGRCSAFLRSWRREHSRVARR